MIKEASYSILDILGFNAGFYVRDLDLNPGDVSLIPWTVTSSSSGLTRLLRSFKRATKLSPSAGFISTDSGRAGLGHSRSFPQIRITAHYILWGCL